MKNLMWGEKNVFLGYNIYKLPLRYIYILQNFKKTSANKK